MDPLWQWITGEDGVRALSFPFLERLGGVRALFTSRHRGASRLVPVGLNLVAVAGEDPGAVAENRRRALALIGSTPDRAVIAGLVHGREVARVDAPPPPDPHGVRAVPGVDGLVTATPDLTLMVTAADCVPIYLYDPHVPAVGLLHAGWRGTAAGIARVGVERLAAEYGSRPERIWAVIGPAIGPCCYEVDEPVRAAMAAAPGFRPGWLRPGRRPDRWQLDLWQANRDQLVAAGVPVEQIGIAGICTACQRADFFSHRGEGGRTGRQAALIRLVGGRRHAG
ncbi:MAG: peptidoglycan editing factor PgeF [Firmicutes bacterium]|nr:peptidoglycan editing factor PgeF [Bacillota bacterium]